MTRTVTSQREVRLDARLTREQKDLIAWAAALDGQSLTEFVVSSAQRAAEDRIKARQILELTARDTETFLQAIENPPEPNAHLRAAVADYHTFVGHGRR